MSVTEVTLGCPTCGGSCEAIHAQRYCDNCWYGMCGGDLASDEALASEVTQRVVGSTIYWYHPPSMSP